VGVVSEGGVGVSHPAEHFVTVIWKVNYRNEQYITTLRLYIYVVST